MRAALVMRYGSPSVIRIGEQPAPVAARGEVLIRVRHASVSRTDCGELRGHPLFIRFFYGIRRPRRSVFGLDFAGQVEAVGSDVDNMRPGDRVFGMCPSNRAGAHAEYLCVPVSMVTTIPSTLPSEQSVVCEGAFYANAILNRLGLKSGQGILIYGASGAIGTALLQLAKSAGAAVTAVVSTPHLALARSLGADHVIDYTAADFTRAGLTFDFVVDAVGKTSYFRCRRLIKPGGRFAAADLGVWGQNVLLAAWSVITRSHRIVMAAPRKIGTFPVYLKLLMESGQYRAIIDRSYPFAAIADAYRYVETGQKAGVVIINMPDSPKAPWVGP